LGNEVFFILEPSLQVKSKVRLRSVSLASCRYPALHCGSDRRRAGWYRRRILCSSRGVCSISIFALHYFHHRTHSLLTSRIKNFVGGPCPVGPCGSTRFEHRPPLACPQL